MNKIHLLYGLFLFLPFLTFSQDSLLVEAFKKQQHPLQFERGMLSGEGLNWLEGIAQESPFFLIGEDHGIAEIPLFTAALFRAFKKQGYRYFATETGPFTATFLQDMATREGWLTEYQRFLTIYPWSIPFYAWREECEILNAVVDASADEESLVWGLDQEFAASFRMNFKALQESAQTEESRKLATQLFEKALNGFQQSTEEKNPGKSYMAAARPEDFEQLKTAFSDQSANLKRIQELEESIYIYQLWFQNKGYQSNYLRAEMMKQHFQQYYAVARQKEDQPKVMFKFGANHMYRGANGLNIFDIGNHVSELASQMNTSSFHLYVIGRKGTQNGYTPFSRSEADKAKTYDATQYLDKIDFTTLFEATSTDQWTLIDLRPIREALFNGSIKAVHPGLEKIIWSYDAVLVIPEVTASHSVLDK